MAGLLAMAMMVAVDGAVPAAVTLDAAALGALPQAAASAVLHRNKVSCEGPWLADVLVHAGVPAGEAVRGPALTLAVVATAADGYRVAFTVGELDAKLGHAPVLVATRCNGAPIGPEDGPVRLIAADETRGARSVRQLVRLTVVDAAPR